MKKSIVTISRNWNNPQILTQVDIDGISLKISLHNFLEALKCEIGSVAFIFTKDDFANRLDVAAKKVIEGIKQESIKAMIK